MERYILVLFPDSQNFMEHPRFDECEPSTENMGAYFVPEDLYNEVLGIEESDK